MGNWTPEEHPVEYVECQCGDVNHVTRFCWWRWEQDKDDDYWHELSIETQLNLKWPWWRRVWLAIRYIFGMQCRYGHWNEGALTVDEVKKLKEICERFIADEEAKSNR